MTKLTPKQLRFCQEYIIDLNATQAAIRAGYSKKTASEQSSRLLTNVKVQAEIVKLKAKQSERLELSADEILRECHRIATADVGLAFKEDGTLKDIHDIPVDVRKAISGFEVVEEFGFEDGKKEQIGWLKKVKFWSKDKNIETLFKHLGLFREDNEQKNESLAEFLIAMKND